MILPILEAPHDILSAVAEPVDTNDLGWAELATDMIETMTLDGRGAGLAAPQVGQSVRLITVSLSLNEDGTLVFPRRRDDPVLVLANPEYTPAADITAFDAESCLSVPGVGTSVARHTDITLTCSRLTSEGWVEHTSDAPLKAAGFAARLLLHEGDHLDGITTYDSFTRQQRRRYERGKAKRTRTT